MVPPWQAEAVEHSAHAVLADAEGDGPALRVLPALGRGVVQLGPGVAGQVGPAGHQARHLGPQGVEGGVDGVTGGDLLAGRRATPGASLASRAGPDCPRRRPTRRDRRSRRPAASPRRFRPSGPGGWPGGRSRGRRRAPRTSRRAAGPRISLVARTSSSPRGEPWAFGLSVRCGAGQAMWLRRISRLGRSSTALARRRASSRAAVSLATSPSRSTCQP